MAGKAAPLTAHEPDALTPRDTLVVRLNATVRAARCLQEVYRDCCTWHATQGAPTPADFAPWEVQVRWALEAEETLRGEIWGNSSGDVCVLPKFWPAGLNSSGIPDWIPGFARPIDGTGLWEVTEYAFGVQPRAWPTKMRAMEAAYRPFPIAIYEALDCLDAGGGHMDLLTIAPDDRWTTRVRIELQTLLGCAHPLALGDAGLGLIRGGCRELPAAFAESLLQITKRIQALNAVPDPNIIRAGGTAVTVPTLPGGSEQRGIGGTDTDWKDVQDKLLGKRDRGEPYTSERRLAEELGCSSGTISKAIDKSESLRGWVARHVGAKAAPKATGVDGAVADNTRQSTEPAPDDFLPPDDVDATMARLIEQANPEERAKLNTLDEAGRRELVATYQAQNLDDEPSPLETDPPGKRRRKVTAHKRA